VTVFRSKINRVLTLFGVGALAVTVVGLSIKHVPESELGVRFRRFQNGTELERSYAPGWHWISPWDRFNRYTVTDQTVAGEAQFLDATGGPRSIRYELTFALAPEHIPLIHQKVGPDYVEILIRPEVVAELRRHFGTDAAVATDTSYATEVAQRVGTALRPHGIELSKLNLQ
jgi:regulator of protease activity HflC (stomatin/prohibitin superfamily)